MYLADLTKGRDNNLTLLRIIAASAVLVSHSFVLSTGDPDTEPLRTWIGMTPGSIAVDIFFVVSGFLVTASISKSHDALDFLVARCLRIFPALLILLLITIFFLGPIITTVPLGQYFGRETITYFLKCATLIRGVAYDLPGLFSTNPYKNAVNGSLWTMTWEIRSYIVLLLVWWAASSIGKWSARGFLVLTILIGCSLYGLMQFLHLSGSQSVHTVMPLLMFTLGAVMWQLRHRILLSWRGFAFATALICLTPTVSVNVFYALFPVAMTYAVMFLAFVPAGAIRKYNRIGDYSYGLYLYAFPIQQLLAMAWPGITPGQMILSAFVCTILFAIVSWHLIEERALEMKLVIVTRLRTIQSKFSST
jgi:peptidoglycan/LPS O-acetylase OafA/YrhL